MRRVGGTPAVFGTLGLTQSLIGRDEIGRIEDSYPRDKAILSGTAFGSLGTGPGRNPLRQVHRAQFGHRAARPDLRRCRVVDASASYKPSSNWTLTVGADNLLDKYPDRTEDLQNSTFGMLPYSNYSPFGFNGAYVYGRIKYTGRVLPAAGRHTLWGQSPFPAGKGL